MYLVTGGAGFIGSNIADALAARGDDVVICDRLRNGNKWHNIRRTRLYDIVHPDNIDAWLDGNAKKLTAIIHMGAISATTETDVDKLVHNNIALSLKLWQFAAEHAIPLIYASSAATYGDGAQGFVDDQSPDALAQLRPLNAYGWSKLFADKRFVDDVLAGRPTPPQWAGLKFFNVYGPNESHKGDMRSVINKVYPKVVAGDVVQLFKSHDPRYQDGGQLRDFVYVKDCVRIILWLLDNRHVSGIFNVGTGKARTFHDLVHAVGKAVGKAPNIEFIDMPLQIRDRYQYFTEADMRKVAAAGYNALPTSLEDGVLDYVQCDLSAGPQ